MRTDVDIVVFIFEPPNRDVDMSSDAGSSDRAGELRSDDADPPAEHRSSV